MSQLMIASRKGLLVVAPDSGKIVAHHFAGEPVSQFLCDTRDGSWYACLNLGHFGSKLRRSKDEGNTWQEITCPAFPPKPTDGMWADDLTPWSVGHIWALELGHANQPGTLWAGCMPAGLFRSNDYGQTWQLIESLWLDERRRGWMGGGNDHPGMHSVLIDPRDANHLTVAISCGGIWTSYNAGGTWELIGKGQRATFMPEEAADEPNGQDPHRLIANTKQPDTHWIQHHCGIFVSHDGSQHYHMLKDTKEFGFGFALAVDPHDSSTAWFVPATADIQRYPIDYAMSVMRTSDGGKTFEHFRKGLPQQQCFDLVYRHGLAIDHTGNTLAMASTTGNLWVSEDRAESWRQLSGVMPPVAALGFV